jgi:hypothetical protein
MRLDNTTGLLKGIIQEQFPEAPEHQCIACALAIRDEFNREEEPTVGASAYAFKLGYETGIHHCLCATQKTLDESEFDNLEYNLVQNFIDTVEQELKKKEESQ